MTGEARYLNDCLEKIEYCLKNGCMTFRNVLLTFDNGTESIDVQQIEWIITKFSM